MVIRPHGLHNIRLQCDNLELRGEEIEVQERTNVALFVRVAQGAGVEPADEKAESGLVDFWEAEFLGTGGGFGFVVEDGGEEGGVVAEELLVEGVVGVFFADVDIYEGMGEESVRQALAMRVRDGKRMFERTHGEVSEASHPRFVRARETLW